MFCIIHIKEGKEGGRGLLGQWLGVVECVDILSIGVGAIVKHALGECMGLCHGLDAEASKHGIRFPVAQELNGIFINLSAQEGGGATQTEAVSADEFRLNAGLRL